MNKACSNAKSGKGGENPTAGMTSDQRTGYARCQYLFPRARSAAVRLLPSGGATMTLARRPSISAGSGEHDEERARCVEGGGREKSCES